MRIKRIGSWFLCVCVVALVGLAGCKDNKAETKSRMQELGLVTLTSIEKTDRFPDLSTPEAARTGLDTGFQAVKAQENHSDLDESIFIHPASGKPFVPNASLSNVDLAKIETPVTMILFYAPEPDGDQRAALFVDGHVEWIDEINWNLRKAASGIT